MSEDSNKYTELVREILDKKDRQSLAYVYSYGCQQNVSDGEHLAGRLSAMGYGITYDMNEADIILLNTCAVRENAELKFFGNLGGLKALKEKNPELIIAVCGCMVQQTDIAEKIKKTYRQVDIVFGTFAFGELPRLLYTALTEHKKVCDISERARICTDESIIPVRSCSYKAGVSVMYGCDNFCSYCIVPYVRGREVSREPEAILSEMRSLAESGCKEIMLLGQNVNSYGKGLSPKINFSELLRRINEIDGDFRVRFMSPHPKDADNEFMDTVAGCGKICKSLHLPLQSGSSRILKAMNRRYTAEEYYEKVSYMRSLIPDFSLTTDIIVGFPGETREDFEQTLDMIKKVRFDNIYSFIYSKRKGTAAAAMDDPVSDEEKGLWFREMLALQREISTEYYKRFLGKTMKVLFDGESRREGFISGKSDEFVIVEAKGSPSHIGSFKNVLITETHNWAVCGEITD